MKSSNLQTQLPPQKSSKSKTCLNPFIRDIYADIGTVNAPTKNAACTFSSGDSETFKKNSNPKAPRHRTKRARRKRGELIFTAIFLDTWLNEISVLGIKWQPCSWATPLNKKKSYFRSPALMEARPVCRYFNTQGGCRTGNECKFLHVASSEPVASHPVCLKLLFLLCVQRLRDYTVFFKEFSFWVGRGYY